jgi:hypothetical protein
MQRPGLLLGFDLDLAQLHLDARGLKHGLHEGEGSLELRVGTEAAGAGRQVNVEQLDYCPSVNLGRS